MQNSTPPISAIALDPQRSQCISAGSNFTLDRLVMSGINQATYADCAEIELFEISRRRIAFETHLRPRTGPRRDAVVPSRVITSRAGSSHDGPNSSEHKPHIEA